MTLIQMIEVCFITLPSSPSIGDYSDYTSLKPVCSFTKKHSGLRLFLRAYFEPSPIVAALFILDHQASAAAVVVEW